MWRTILFDLDNTLVARDAAHGRYCESFLDRCCSGLSADEQSEAIHEMLTVDQRGYLDRKEYCRWLAERLPESGMSAEAIWGDYRGQLAELVRQDTRVLDLVKRLKQSFRLAVVSNGSGAVQRRKLAAAGLAGRFEDLFISGELGWEKPDERIFLYTLKQLGCAPEEALFVGDDPQRDIGGAGNVGIATCWIAAGRVFPRGIRSPDLTIQNVLELGTVLP